jgi:hypothetical protein
MPKWITRFLPPPGFFKGKAGYGNAYNKNSRIGNRIRGKFRRFSRGHV